MYTIEEFQPAASNDSPRSSGLSALGDICGAVFTSSGIRGAVWSRYAPSSPELSVPNSYFFDLNSAGDAVGASGINNTPTQRACIYRNSQLIDLYPVVGEYSLASKINEAGRVVGWTRDGGQRRAFVYDSLNNQIAFIDPLDGEESCGAFGVNSAGDVAAKSGNRVLLWVNGTVTEVGQGSFLDGINAGRQIVGSVGKPYPGNYNAVVIDASSPSPSATELPLPAGTIGSHGLGINDNGTVVGTCWTAQSYNTGQHAFIYDKGVSTDLNDLIPANSGWVLEFAYGINNKGQIVCDGEYLGQSATAVLTPESIFAGIHRFDKLLVATLFGGVAEDGGGFAIVGGKPIPIDPWGPLRAVGSQLTPERRDVLLAMAAEALASSITKDEARDSLREAAIKAAHVGLDALAAAPPVHTVRSETRSRARTGGGLKRRMKEGRPVM